MLSAVTGTQAFMIYNTHHSLCLEDSAAMGEVLLRKCNLESEAQQWIWIDQGILMCAASFRCLSAIHTETPKTQPCRGPSVDPAELMWDCDGDRLLSRNTSMLLSIDGQHLTLKDNNKNPKSRSQDEGDICQKKFSKSVKIIVSYVVFGKCRQGLPLHIPFFFGGF